RDQMTKRMIKAMSNPYVDIISHPTGRIIGKRAEYEIDLNKILTVAKETDTILEINANPSRLDLNDINIRKAVKAGVKMIINTDAHEERHMDLMNLGVAQARRGWASKTDIVNTKDLTTYFR
ncbi:MAG TPA: DNA polymerase III, partial [Candidatus Pacearchaeota archaeon]|nr:DNA polymerase III [Candidatus Pacearchaeota archaeon]